MTDITVTFQTSAREQVRAARGLIARQKAGWFLYALFLGFPVVLSVYVAFFDPDPRPWNWWFIVGLGIFGGLYLYLFPWIPVLTVRKGQPSIDGPHAMNLNDGGVQVVSPHSRFELGWEAVVKALETAEFFFIYTGKNVAQMLPKRVLTPDALMQVRALLRSRLGRRAHLRELAE